MDFIVIMVLLRLHLKYNAALVPLPEKMDNNGGCTREILQLIYGTTVLSYLERSNSLGLYSLKFRKWVTLFKYILRVRPLECFHMQEHLR